MMPDRKYSIVTGFSEHLANGVEFLGTWERNTMKYAAPESIYIIGAGMAEKHKKIEQVRKLRWINTVRDLGHQGKTEFPAQQRLGGWSAGVLVGALLCYHDRVDMIYKEQDCLVFGPWVKRLYDECGERGMIFGKPNTGDGPGGVSHGGLMANSLFLVKWESLVDFVALYSGFSLGGSFQSDATVYPEEKFRTIAEHFKLPLTTMGYDRSRPIGYDDEAFYAQQLTADEMVELLKRGLI